MKDLQIIKKKWGDTAMKFCRENFPLLLDQTGLLPQLLQETIHDKCFFKDLLDSSQALNFKTYIYSIADVDDSQEELSNKSVQELLSEKNYVLQHCKTADEVKHFKKYYRSDESLCTFSDISNRLKTCHIFWIVKEELLTDINYFDSNRDMKRQDVYGTSCCSIQFSKRGGYLSIKNRYNHKVSNCDATFSNNLDNIVEGLTNAFRGEFNLEFDSHKSKIDLDNYVMLKGKFYKYTQEQGGNHFGRDWYQSNDGVVEINKAHQKIIDNHYLLDFKTKTIKNLLDYNTDLDLQFDKIVVFKNELDYRQSDDEYGVLKIFEA